MKKSTSLFLDGKISLLLVINALFSIIPEGRANLLLQGLGKGSQRPQTGNLTGSSLNISSFQLPSLSSVLPFSNLTSALSSGLGAPLVVTPPIKPLIPDAFRKQAAFDNMPIPARPVHTAGAGAYGKFTVTTDFAKGQTMMDLFSSVGQTTPVVARFSNALSEKGSHDTSRNVRGFAFKFQTNKGPWDLLLNNAPVFFIRDPVKFPILIQSQGRDPRTNLGQADTAFNYFPSNPETLNLFLRLFSSAGTSRGWIYTNAWSGNTYRWFKSDGSWSYVRMFFQTNQGVQNFTASESFQVLDPNFSAQELYDSIQSGKFPSWTMYAQVLSPKQAESFRYNVLDDTKEWPIELVKPYEIGVLELNKNPENYFNEVEKQAFSVANIIPGWDVSQDPVLQMRLFAYGDSARNRLGNNGSINPLPIQSPLPKILAPKYDASHTQWISQALKSMEQISPIDFEQPSFFYGNLSQKDQAELIENIAGGLSVVSSADIRSLLINWLAQSSTDLSQKVTAKLKNITLYA